MSHVVQPLAAREECGNCSMRGICEVQGTGSAKILYTYRYLDPKRDLDFSCDTHIRFTRYG